MGHNQCHTPLVLSPSQHSLGHMLATNQGCQLVRAFKQQSSLKCNRQDLDWRTKFLEQHHSMAFSQAFPGREGGQFFAVPFALNLLGLLV